MTAAQIKLLAAITKGERRYRSIASNSRIGRTLEVLLRKGLVSATRHPVPAMPMRNGMRSRFGAFTEYSNITVS